jgi:ribonuclease J
VPVHGTYRHLQRHAELAQSKGVIDVQVVENGTALLIHPQAPLKREIRRAVKVTRVACGGEFLEEATRRKRLDLARYGVVFASLTVDGENNLTEGPVVTTLGLPSVDDDEGAKSVLENAVRRTLVEHRGVRFQALDVLLRSRLKNAVNEMCGVRPKLVLHLTRQTESVIHKES